ncbi:MAG: PTS glucose transporter subunit IIA [Clostridiales bacterium]|nr:PTS glucose transporter subunit IIA [Clostridiales bacterium]
MKYEKLAKDIIKNVGGKDNVISVAHCVTRLRFRLKDESKAKTNVFKKMDGVVTVLSSGGQYQVVIGNHVPDVYSEVASIGGFGEGSDDDTPNNGSILDKFIDIVSGVFTPILSVLCAAGMMKGFNALFMALGFYGMDSGTYLILNAIGDSLFYFFPIFLGYTSAKKFKLNPFVGMAIGATLVYPSIVGSMGVEPMSVFFEGTMFAAPVRLKFLGLPVVMMNYTSSVIPIIFATYMGSKFEKGFKKIIPDVVKAFLVPFFTMLVAIPLTLIIVGPITTVISQLLGNGILAVLEISPVLAGLVLGGLWQIMVIFGLHWGIIPAIINNLMTNGYDVIIALVFSASFAQIGVVLAIMFKTKDKKLKALSVSAFISGIFGVTEPAIYGITLPRKKPFIISCIAASIGGGVAGLMGAQIYMMGGLGVFALPSAIHPVDGIGNSFYAMVVAMLVGFGLGFVMMMMTKFKDEVVEEEKGGRELLRAPMNGVVMPLSSLSDGAFSKGALGRGIAVEPKHGKVISPADGVITTFFETGHAVGITTNNGTEILIHVGMDTVKLGGRFFTPKAKQGDVVKAGDLLLEFDLKGIKGEGYVTATPIVITNSADYLDIFETEQKNIAFGDDFITLIK